jgi:hypothetical protein
VFVGLGIDPQWRHHGGGRDGVGGNQVLAGQFPVATTPQGLAVEGEDCHLVVGQTGSEPACQGRLEGDDIESPEQEGVGGFGRRLATAEAEQLRQGEALVAAELGNGLIGFTAGEHGEDGQAEDGREGVAEAPAVAGVGNLGQDSKQGQGGRHGKASGLGLGFSALPAMRLPAKLNY